MNSPEKTTAKTPENMDALAALLHELSLTDDASQLRHFVELCKRSERIRSWLFGRFAKDPGTQAKFRAYLQNPEANPDGIWSPVVAQEVASRPPTILENDGPFGGLSKTKIWALIKEYQWGWTSAYTFFLVYAWRQLAASNREAPPALWRGTLDHWAKIVADDEGRSVGDLERAIAFFNNQSTAVWEDSWKVHVLLYILDHPQPSYRVNELFNNLPEKLRGANANGNPKVADREIRKFCKDHGIRRDSKAGRPPRKSK